MTTWDAGDGSFISHFNEHQHWTFPEHNRKRFVPLNGLIHGFPLILNGIISAKENLPASILNATAYVKSSYLVESTHEVWKLKYCVWAGLVKRPDNQCLCTSFSYQWLGNSGGSTTVVIFGTPCPIYRHASFCVTQSVSLTVPENPSGPPIDYFLVLTCAVCGSKLCGLLPGVDRWSSLHDPRVIGPYHRKLWGWPLHYADFIWFLGGLKPKKSRRDPSFSVTQMVKRVW